MRRRPRPRARARKCPALAWVLVIAGSIALMASVILPTAASVAPIPPEEDFVLAEAAAGPAQPKRVSPAPQTEPPAPTSGQQAQQTSSTAAAAPTPATIKSAPPLDAGPAIQARAIGGLPSTSNRSTASSPSTSGPFSIVVATAGDAFLAGLAGRLVSNLHAQGFDARVSEIAAAGRPDAILALGFKSAAGADVWYCDPGPPAGAVFATALQAATVALQSSTSGDSSSDGPEADFPCDQVQAGRARTAAALLELPPDSLKRPDSLEVLDRSLAGAVARYFSENAASIRAARAAPRLIWPAIGPITSPYGPSHPLGIDIGMGQGNVVAASDGTVSWAGGNPCCSYGIYVVIDGPDGIQTLYAHLASLDVRKGQRVRQGQSLGKVGCTGHCTGNHLHFEVIDNGVRKNPASYLP